MLNVTFKFLMLIIISASATPLFAQVDTVQATYKYIMGDNDTKTDARNLCFLYAKKLCMEKVGTFVQTQLSVKKRETHSGGYSEVTTQDIKTYSGAFLKVEVINENLSFVGETIAISMTVRAVVNAGNILDQITAVKQDQALAKRIKDQQDQLVAMEAKIREIQIKLKATNTDLVKPARVERVEVFAKMSELEAVKYDIRLKTKKALDYVELGMTVEEVVMLIGKPRSFARHYAFKYPLSYNYGNVWVVFESNIVSCLVRAEYFNEDSGRSRYSRKAIIK